MYGRDQWELIMLFLEWQVWDWSSSTYWDQRPAVKSQGSLHFCISWEVLSLSLFQSLRTMGVWLLLFLVHTHVFQSMIEIVCNCLEMDISHLAATWSYILRVDFKYYFYWHQATAVHFKVNVFSQHGNHRIDLYIWVDLTRGQNCLVSH